MTNDEMIASMQPLSTEAERLLREEMRYGWCCPNCWATLPWVSDCCGKASPGQQERRKGEPT